MVFRPMSSEVYDDVILFKVLDGPNAGGFNVPVRALLPTLQVRHSNAARRYHTKGAMDCFALCRQVRKEAMFVPTVGRQRMHNASVFCTSAYVHDIR